MKKVLVSVVLGLGMLSNANALAGDAEAGKTKAAVCAACHGNNGIGSTDMYPNLAGQHADYIVKQLKAFKSGDRKDPVMAPMAMPLSDTDMADVAAYFATFNIDGSSKGGDSAAASGTAPAAVAAAAPAAYKPDPVKGKSLYIHGDKARGITSCIGCHGEDGNSDVLINPNLSNQHAEYIEKQLAAFKASSRHNAVMNQVAGNMTAEDIADIGAYFKDTAAVADVKASVPVAAKSFGGDIAKGKTLAATCAACHGADGNAALPMHPSLAGQGEAYLVKQIHDFKKGKEGRDNAVMYPMVASLSDQDIKDLSAFFASQELRPANAEANEVGKKLYFSGDNTRSITACAACHSVDGKGMENAMFPGIAGQNADYLKSQLEQFRSGARNNDRGSMMRNIAAKLTDEDIAALSQFMASIR